MKNICLSLVVSFLMFSGSSLKAQDMETKPGFLSVFGMVTLEGSKIKTARVNVYDGNQLAMELATSKKGEFVTELALNKHYTFEFMADGAVTKRIAINTYVEKKNAAPVPFDCFIDLVSMEQVAGKDISTLDFPVAMIKYNEKKKEFEPELGYSMNMMKEYNKALEKSEETN